MTVGPNIGPKFGPRFGPAIGIGADPFSSGASAAFTTTDATSGIFVPATGAEFTSAGFTAPNFLWLMQEASGNLADTIGACTLTAASAPGYQTAVTGWTRKAVSWVDASISKFTNAAAYNSGTTSIAFLTYQYVSSVPAATRFMMQLGNATAAATEVLLTTGNLRAADGANSANGSAIADGVVRPFLIVYNRTATTFKLYTNVDKLAPTYASLSSVLIGIGGSGGAGSPTGGAVWGCAWTGANGEAFNDTQSKSLLTALGWAPSWS